MSRARGLGVALVALAATAAPGCGLGSGDASEGEATLTVTRDYGSEPVLEATRSDPPESETVIRLLDREAEISTRYGGGFVQSIEGISGERRAGRTADWFFFVNGVESDRGAAEVEVRGGDRIWWDFRDWTDALRTPAVVGAWPEPFAQAAAGADRLPVRIGCHGAREPCDAVAAALAERSVDARVGPARATGGPALRLLVGRWQRVRADPAAAQLERGPQTSGVFARFGRAGGGWELAALDRRGEPATEFGAGAGLVAAVRLGERPPTWVVTGTDAAGVSAAVALLDAERLADRYAVLAAEGTELALPTGEAG